MHEWQRVVLDDGEDRFVELTAVGTCVYLRKGRRDAEPSIEMHELSSPEAAQKSIAKRIVTLRKKGYLLDDPVQRPVPTQTSRDQRAAAMESGRLRFEAGLPQFVAEWHALGFEPVHSFVESVRGTQRYPGEVADACLSLAARVFGVAFAGVTRSYDVEHGDRMRILRTHRAQFYESPAKVLSIVLRKLQGRSQRSDDIDGPGLEDEIRMQLKRFPSAAPSPRNG